MAGFSLHSLIVSYLLHKRRKPMTTDDIMTATTLIRTIKEQRTGTNKKREHTIILKIYNEVYDHRYAKTLKMCCSYIEQNRIALNGLLS